MTAARAAGMLRRMNPQAAIFIAFELYAVLAALLIFAALRPLSRNS